MQVLRDLRSFTKLLILAEIKSQPRSKLKDIAAKLDITVQGASEYLKLMIKENLIVKTNGEHRLTQAGVEFLHKNMSELKSFVDSNIKELNIIDSCTAIAFEDLKKGDVVGLEMLNGMLVAKNNKKPKSKGKVLYSVKEGEDVVIVNLTGIVEYDYGKLIILELPTSLAGGSKAVVLKKIKLLVKENMPDKIAITNPVGQVIFNKIGLKPDIEFSSLTSSLEAAQRGLNVMLATSTDAITDTISFIEDFNSKTKNKIEYNVIPKIEIERSDSLNK